MELSSKSEFSPVLLLVSGTEMGLCLVPYSGNALTVEHLSGTCWLSVEEPMSNFASLVESVLDIVGDPCPPQALFFLWTCSCPPECLVYITPLSAALNVVNFPEPQYPSTWFKRKDLTYRNPSDQMSKLDQTAMFSQALNCVSFMRFRTLVSVYRLGLALDRNINHAHNVTYFLLADTLKGR